MIRFTRGGVSSSGSEDSQGLTLASGAPACPASSTRLSTNSRWVSPAGPLGFPFQVGFDPLEEVFRTLERHRPRFAAHSHSTSVFL